MNNQDVTTVSLVADFSDTSRIRIWNYLPMSLINRLQTSCVVTWYILYAFSTVLQNWLAWCSVHGGGGTGKGCSAKWEGVDRSGWAWKASNPGALQIHICNTEVMWKFYDEIIDQRNYLAYCESHTDEWVYCVPEYRAREYLIHVVTWCAFHVFLTDHLIILLGSSCRYQELG